MPGMCADDIYQSAGQWILYFSHFLCGYAFILVVIFKWSICFPNDMILTIITLWL